MGKRMTGRAGQAALARRRAAHPVCEHCEARGIVRAADEMDHILCLALGGEDVDENIQGLCLACHAIKTALEQASTGGAATHPDWLRPASCRLTIVSGPPASGKSTLVEREAGGRDVVIDLDDLAERIAPGFAPARRWTGELLNRAIRARNALLGSLSQMPGRSQAWLIVSAPSVAEREWWRSKLNPADWRHLDPGKAECVRRVIRRAPSSCIARHVEIVDQWYLRARLPWSAEKAPRKRAVIGADGYPVEDKA